MSKKVSLKEMKDFINEIDEYELPIVLRVGDKTLPVIFHPYLSLCEETDFVNDVVSYVFDKSGNYNSENIDIAFTAMILKYLSNVTLPTTKDKNTINLSIIKDWDNRYHFIDNINSIPSEESIGDKFKKYIKYLKSITNSKIDYIKNKSKSDVLFDELITFVRNLEEKTKNVNLSKLMNEANDAFNKVKGMDEGKFVTAIVDNAKKESNSKTNETDKAKDNITKIEDVKTK